MKTILSLLLIVCIHVLGRGQTYFNNLYDYNNQNQQVFNFHQLNDGSFQLNFNSFLLSPLNVNISLMSFDQFGNELFVNHFNKGSLISPLAYADGSAVLYNGITNFITTTPYSSGANSSLQAELIKVSDLDTVTTYLMGGAIDTVSVILAMKHVYNNLILAGVQSTSNNNDGEDFWLTKCDTNGQVIWQNWYGGSGQDRLLSMDTTGDGGYVLCGRTSSIEYSASYQNTNFLVVFVDSMGNTIISRTLGGPNNEGGYLRTLSDTSYLLYGMQENNNGQNEIFVSKLNYLGSIIWQNTYTFGPYDNSVDDVELVDDGFVFCGYSMDNYGDPNGLIMKTDFDGNLQWGRKYKPRANDNYLRDLQVMPDGGFIVAGFVYGDSINVTSDAWIMRTNCLGFDGPPEANATFQSLQGYNLMIEDLSKRYGTLYVDFGDGVQDTFPEQVSPLFINHTYAQDSVYTIQIIAEACNGESDTLYYDFHATNTIGVEDYSPDIKFKIYPNPSDGKYTLEYELTDSNAQITIHDIMGRVIQTHTLEGKKGKFKLDLQAEQNGVYILQLSNEKGQKTYKLMKQ
ncbi:Por secretion system C-terminal sorting domain-containing protein [Lishizhenia tianjinensis]|uniref:Por secretion system C-terminal sorting domain-containing protein n=1 Tax=Lishizhenia tianjinensis TaxID=477690 RepID=A0A1I6YZ55_9FLAO|nr:T9SS type A sorting domain-containing protein [Lishizhenia tianjinensis]SFT55739.1 Por secretion system C-terminal sorting domain-containing protein [Lishizhenia tianjinensis]